MANLINWILSHVIAKFLVGLLLVVFTVSAEIVNHDELSIKTRFGEKVGKPLEPGLNFIFPFMDEIRRYKTTIQFLLITDKSVSNNKEFQEVLYDEGVSVTFSDRIDAKLVFEVSYQIKSDEDNVGLFISTFGREESDEGIVKIEKIIADTVRITSRSVLSKVDFESAEKKVIEYSAIIKNISNGKDDGDHDISKYLQQPSLGELGIEVVRLGYRIQASKSYRDSRKSLANEIDIELDRKRLIEAKMASDDLESERLKKEAEFKLELAKLRRKEFEALPDSAKEKILASIVNKWNGSLPRVLNMDEKNTLSLMTHLLEDEETEQGTAVDR